MVVKQRQESSKLVTMGHLLAHPSGRLYGPPYSFLVRNLPTPSLKAPSGSAWVHEVKHDGYPQRARLPSVPHLLPMGFGTTGQGQKSVAVAKGGIGLRATSSRNGGRNSLGMVGGIIPE